MPVADYKTYCKMLDEAGKKQYAYPAINVTSIVTANAALKGFADSKSDGIIQVSTGGAEFASGLSVKDMVIGATTLAEHVHRLADRYNVYVALHTDHCIAEKLDTFVNPLIAITEQRRKEGKPNLFNGHMFDGSTVDLKKNMEIAIPLLERCKKNDIILEIEVGVVGGEEDGLKAEGPADKLYTTPEDMLFVAEKMNKVKGARYMVAATFGNVHGVYKPGNVKLKPTILNDSQAAVEKKYGKEAHLDLVFHGGSGSLLSEIHEAIGYGVIKMNIDTDTQYAFTRPIVDHLMKNYDGVLKVDHEVGNKKAYDPRGYNKLGEKAMAARIQQACKDLKSEGQTLFNAIKTQPAPATPPKAGV
jgi:fructose-bisphosphate aldolase class II